MTQPNPHTNEFGQPVGHPLPQWRAPAWPLHKTMIGRFCRLEPIDLARHVPDLFRSLSLDTTGEGWTYLPYGPFASEAELSAFLDEETTGGGSVYYAVIDQASGGAVGFLSYIRIAPEAGSIEIGNVRFSPLLQRTPAATEAVYLMMRHVFDELGYRRCEWKCDNFNTPSHRAAKRFGFTFEGVFRQALVYRGRNRDTAWYSVIDGEWPRLRAAFERWLDPSNFDAAGKQRARLEALRG